MNMPILTTLSPASKDEMAPSLPEQIGIRRDMFRRGRKLPGRPPSTPSVRGSYLGIADQPGDMN
jgi:hypothetical protein